ncbi:MAG TPA: alpha-L-fucosidase [Chitinophagaceae bacterium]|nr:alpha-L-fucosidase [Chitinophagaceae bacterium]
MKKIILVLFLLVFTSWLFAQEKNLPLPTRQQLAWHEMEFYLFVHFGPNTFTDKEWGQGDEPTSVFNPTELDCRQWASIAKDAGAKGIIITAKHHDGFCLWPSNFSLHTVRESNWKEGKGDVLKELSQACKELGLKFGVYISPWDRNHPKYGTADYNNVYVSTMKEVLEKYGPVWELWWDGANGEGPDTRLTDSVGQGKKQVYDWDRYKKMVNLVSPRTLVFSDVGPHIRWVGNEKGIAGTTNWNYLDTTGFSPGLGAPPADTLNQGNVFGKSWIPAEADVSIRPGWFYHAEEDNKVKTGESLFDLYLKSVGRGANLLLNVPPDRRGLIHEKDSAALMLFKKLRDESFADNLLKNAKTFWEVTAEALLKDSLNYRAFDKAGEVYSINRKQFTVQLPQPAKMNCIVLREAIHLGQTVQNFKIILFNNKEQVGEITGTTIGRKRILTFPSTTVTSFKVYLDDRNGNDNVSGIAAYLIDERLLEK